MEMDGDGEATGRKDEKGNREDELENENENRGQKLILRE